MSDRLAAIGIEVDGPAGVEKVVEELLPVSSETIYRGGGSVFEWRDVSGAGLLVTTVTVDNVVQCVTPTFTAGSLVTAVPSGFGTDETCRFCEPVLVDVLDDDGRVVSPLAVHLEDSAITRRQVPIGQSVRMALAGFVEEAKLWEDEAAYQRAQNDSRTPFPVRSLVPVGMLSDASRPHAMVTGVITHTDERENETTGISFRWIRVATHGIDLEVVSTTHTITEAAPGMVLQAMCWMVGRVIDGLTEPTLRERLRRSRAARASAR